MYCVYLRVIGNFMKTRTTRRFDNQNEKEIEKAISKFSYHLMSNSKWIKLIENLVENSKYISTIEFKMVLSEKIGEIYLDENTSFDFDYYQIGIEGINSLKGWILYKEIEYLKFSKNGKQDVSKIKSIIDSIGKFEFIENENELKLLCYK